MTSSISLLSGGLDSIVATKLALRYTSVKLAITFDYGQRARVSEIETARIFCRTNNLEHRVIALPWLKDITKSALIDNKAELPHVKPDELDHNSSSRAKAVWVPNRNGVFISVGAAIAEAQKIDHIITGFNAEEAKDFPDNSANFVNAMNAALKFSTMNKVTIKSATLSMTKAEIAREFISLKIDPEIFWCCYEGSEKLCGECESCARTIRAFCEIGAFDAITQRFS